MKTIKWGIIGTGTIARAMAEGLRAVEGAQLTSVLSRTDESANSFAKKYNIPNRFSNREKFASFKEIDVVYIATPHTQHLDDALLCIHHNKHVLCEKPLGINSQQVETMLEAAQKKHVFFMEAMWSHFFPAIQKTLALIGEGVIGDVRKIDIDFCFRGAWEPEKRLLNLKYAGGALLDVGIYPIFLSQLIMNQAPVKITADAYLGKTGVDEHSSYILRYKNGAMATLSSGIRMDSRHTAAIYGTAGYIEIPKFWQPDSLILHTTGSQETFNFERLGNGYSFEARAVQEAISQGLVESNVVPWSRTKEVMLIMDEIRKQIGLVFPGER